MCRADDDQAEDEDQPSIDWEEEEPEADPPWELWDPTDEELLDPDPDPDDFWTDPAWED